MWYYQFNRKKYGPVSEDKLCELIRMGVINEKTPVVKEGSYNWKWLGEIEPSEYILGNKETPPEEESITSDKHNDINTRAIKVKPYNLRNLFIVWVTLALVDLILRTLGNFLPKMMVTQNQLRCINGLISIEFVLELILLYRFWKLIQSCHPRTTPGKAVGFLFIPIFAFYWNFIAFWGLSKGLNQYIEKLPTGKEIPPQRKTLPQLAFIYSLYTVIASIALEFFFIIKMLTDNPNSRLTIMLYELTVKQNSFPASILYEINEVLLLLTIVDFYLSARSILETEEKR